MGSHRGAAARILLPVIAVVVISPASLRASTPSPPSALARAQELERNANHAEAYAAFSKILKGPGSDHDLAEAEIGAAKALDGLERRTEAVARLRAAAKARAGTQEEPAVLVALASMHQGFGHEESVSRAEAQDLWQRALKGYRRIAASAATPAAAIDAQLGAADCLDELGKSEEAVAGLEAAEKKYRGSSELPRILMKLARFYSDERALAVYRSIVSEFPGSGEAPEAHFAQAIRLRRLGREDEALAVYEEVSRTRAGTEVGAKALWVLGLHYAEREERELAAAYYRKIVDEYPADWRWTRMAKGDLDLLSRYSYSPLYDKLLYWIQHSFVEGTLHIEAQGPLGVNGVGVTLALALTAYVSHLGWLAACLILLAVFGRLAPAKSEPSLLRRHWTILRLVCVLIFIWTMTLALGLFAGSLLFRVPYSLSTRLEDVGQIMVGAAMILVVLWRESPRALFAVPRRGLMRTVRIGAASGLIVLIVTIVINHLRVWLVESGHSSAATSWVPHGPDSDQRWWYVVPYYGFFALAEECFFRGAVLEAFSSRTTSWAAGFLTSVLFAADHMYSLWASVWVFAFGVVMVWLVKKARNLTPPTAVHAALNLFLFALRR